VKISSDAMAKILESHWDQIVQRYNRYQIRTLNAIRLCRTPALGGSLYHCDECGYQHLRYHSCRNRHCPQCQHTQKEQWIQQQEAKLIQVPYYHVVFTIPHLLNELFMAYPRQMYNQFMQCAWKSLDGFGWNHKYLGAQLGCTMVLHTWGSNLSYHPHLHCIIPGGGVTIHGKWRNGKGKGKFIFPVKALGRVFRSKLIISIRALMEDMGMEFPKSFINKLYAKPWVVYAKPPFGGASGVIRYLARYTHKIAITHHRIKYYDANRVVFSYTDYKHRDQAKQMELQTGEFIRRFTQHILPKGFCRIRHYGILSSAWKNRMFPEVKTPVALDFIQFWQQHNLQLLACPKCKHNKLRYVGEILPVRGPPNVNVRPLTIKC